MSDDTPTDEQMRELLAKQNTQDKPDVPDDQADDGQEG